MGNWHSEFWGGFSRGIYGAIHRSPHCLDVNADQASYLKVELIKLLPNMRVGLETKFAVVIPASTDEDGDCGNAIAKLRMVVHDRGTLMRRPTA